LGPLYISEKATNLKFGVQIEYDEYYSKNTKLGEIFQWADAGASA